jgi:hypothetical protein
MKIGVVLVPSQDSWHKRLRGTGNSVGLKVLIVGFALELYCYGNNLTILIEYDAAWVTEPNLLPWKITLPLQGVEPRFPSHLACSVVTA